MTIGFPDWSRTSMEGGQQLGSFFGQKGNDPTTGIMDCIGFAYLTVEIGDAGNVHNFSIVVTWYSDSGGTNIVGTTVWAPVPGSVIPRQVPVVSRYALVTCSHQVFGDTENVGCITFGSNVVVEDIAGSQQTNPFIINSGSVGAASSVAVNGLYTYSGLATIYIYTDTANKCVIQIEFYNINTASWWALAKWDLPAAAFNDYRQVHLPPCPVRIVCYNNDTAAHTFTGILVTG